MARYRLVVAYDGTGFRGFAANPGVRTVSGELTAATERITGVTVDLTCAGRTDAGVHAWGQVVTFDLDRPTDPGRLAEALTAMCGPEIVVRDAALVAHGFDARRSATGRTYRYTVLNRPVPDPLSANRVWHVSAPLSVAAMRSGADALLGEHDFASFCRRREVRDPTSGERREASLVRHVRRAEWVELRAEDEGVLRFEIEASSFCHQMVRSIVGTLVDVGRGRRKAADVRAILVARHRAAASPPAPAQGLCLWEVSYRVAESPAAGLSSTAALRLEPGLGTRSFPSG